MYKLIPNFSLKYNNSFGLDVRSCYWLSIGSTEDWYDAMAQYPHVASEKRFIIGGGTNLLFLSDFDGLVVSPDISGYRITYQDDLVVEIEVGAGVEWDDFVAYCVDNRWFGVENLSLIPGTVGAAAVQNIGAYGVEVERVISKVNSFKLDTLVQVGFSHEECHFSYRSSIFKEEADSNLMVTSVVFRLHKQGELLMGYGDLNKTISELGGATLQNVRSAVIHIRQSKLPNPKMQGNAGSFFKNPVLSAEDAALLADFLPGLPIYPLSDGSVKVAAGFLIDQAGWKGKRMGQAAVHDMQALVLVNLGGATGAEILELSMAIQQDILEKFGVVLEREVQVIC